MTRAQAKERIDALRKTINYHRYLYHVLDRQEISDAALDSLKHELYKLEQQFPDLMSAASPTQRVGGKSLEKFQKVRHATPMLSMEDVFVPDELEEWCRRLSRIIPSASFDYYTELKMDGLAVSLEYTDGVLEVGSTRGNGVEGEDVTQNLKTIEAIPLQLRIPSDHDIDLFLKTFGTGIEEKKFRSRLKGLDGHVEIRGEVFMTKKTFDALNRAQEKKGESPFANPRNASAGSIRQLDSRITASRKLDFFGYALMEEESFGLATHQQSHELLKIIGIKCNPYNEYCADLKGIENYHVRMGRRRDSLPYWTDGVVVVVNSNSLFRKLGVAGKAPRGMIAYKFPAEQATTVVESVTFQVGRTGALTPVAHLKPVFVAGTTVTNATLHNIDEIERLGVKINDTVIIEKAGDIIPKVVRVLKEMRSGNEQKIHTPKKCPICGSPVERKVGEVALYCSNRQCFGQEKEAIIHFVSRKAFDIDGLGEKIVEQLMNVGLIQTAADLFTLTRGDLEPLEGFAVKKAQNLVDAIQQKKTIDLPRFLYALGIRHIGEETARDLASRFGTLRALLEASKGDIESVPNIGTVVADSAYEYLHDSVNRRFIETLLERGVEPLPFKQHAKQTFAGRSFVLTGELDSLTRDQAKQKIHERGGDVSSSVSKNTSFIVVGANPGSKYEKAKKLDVPILSEKEFLKMIEE